MKKQTKTIIFYYSIVLNVTLIHYSRCLQLTNNVIKDIKKTSLLNLKCFIALSLPCISLFRSVLKNRFSILLNSKSFSEDVFQEASRSVGTQKNQGSKI